VAESLPDSHQRITVTEFTPSFEAASLTERNPTSTGGTLACRTFVEVWAFFVSFCLIPLKTQKPQNLKFGSETGV